MTEHRKRQLERLLRTARQRAFDDPRYERIIAKVKRRLIPEWDRRVQERALACKEQWMNTVWM